MKIILTRPRDREQTWLQAFQQAGLDVRSLPLIRIRTEALQGRLLHARQNPQAWDVWMFVSGNAVRGFLPAPEAGVSVLPVPGASTLRAWSPGPGTRAALLQAGWPAAQIDAPSDQAAQFESESLWAAVAGQVRPGLRVLIIRGGDARGQLAGRDWLAGKLGAAGAQVEQVVAYRRLEPEWTERQSALARQAASDGSLWVFTSSQAIAHLRRGLPEVDWRQARALVTHERIAAAARSAGFAVAVLSRPQLADVLAAIACCA